jgi:hypothetical protein
MKRKKGTVERFSPAWIRMIPMSLAKGIWGEIEDALEGREHAETRATARRKRQIDRGIIKSTATTDDLDAQLSAADERNKEKREIIKRAREKARRAAAENAGEGESAGAPGNVLTGPSDQCDLKTAANGNANRNGLSAGLPDVGGEELEESGDVDGFDQ